MLRISSDSSANADRARQIVAELESLLDRRVYCLYQDMTVQTPEESLREQIYSFVVAEARVNLEQVGHVDKLSVLVESPGGNPDAAYRLVRTFRRYCDSLEAIVVNWAKSGATFFCLGTDKIFLSDDGELGPLDTQIPDPQGGRHISALNVFKSLEFLREHALESADLAVRMYVEGYGMHLPNAIKNSRQLVSDMVQPLFRQVDPLPLGEARRHLQVGEEYSKLVMEKYSYKHLSREKIEKIVRNLVWEYPSHGYVIDREMAEQIGLNVARPDDAVTNLCEELLGTVKGCVGITTPSTVAASTTTATPTTASPTAAPTPAPATSPVNVDSNGSGKEEGHEIQTQVNKDSKDPSAVTN